MQVTLSPKYQVVIPKEIRQQLNLKRGQKIQVIVKGGLIILAPDYPLSELRGVFRGMSSDGIREEDETAWS